MDHDDGPWFSCSALAFVDAHAASLVVTRCPLQVTNTTLHLQYKVWVKPQSEMSFLYGNNVVKSGLGRMTEGIPQYAGVIVYSMSDIPLGK